MKGITKLDNIIKTTTKKTKKKGKVANPKEIVENIL